MPKYKLLPTAEVTLNGVTMKVRRIQATTNIRRHNVSKGDLGGYLKVSTNGSKKMSKILSHRGDCWIGGEAVVMGNIRVRGNALINQDACVRGLEFGRYLLGYTNISDKDRTGIIEGNTLITGSAKVAVGYNNVLTGQTYICDNATAFFLAPSPGMARREMVDILISGQAWISNPSKPMSNCKFAGSVRINSTTEPLRNVNLSSGVFEYLGLQNARDFTLRQKNNAGNSTVSTPLDNKKWTTFPNSAGLNTLEKDIPVSKNDKYSARIQAVEDEYNSYCHDIVRLIKYPLMANLDDPAILDFVYNLKRAKRLVKEMSTDELSSAIQDLEKSFLQAESKARTVLTTKLDIDGQKSIETVEKLLAIAYDGESSENEKRSSCKQAIKGLQGVLPVGEMLVENLWATVGLKELETTS